MSKTMNSVGLIMALATCAGCASEGGVVGSGISASISGNVAALESNGTTGTAAVTASGRFSGIRVSIDEAPAAADTTNDEGRFALTGDFAGLLTLRFALSGKTLAMMALDVPAGADLDLEDVELRPSLPQGVQAREIRQRNVYGRAVSVACGAGEIAIEDDIGNLFRVVITQDTMIRTAQQRPAACADVMRGGRVMVESLVLPGRLIHARTIIVSPLPRLPKPTVTIPR